MAQQPGKTIRVIANISPFIIVRIPKSFAAVVLSGVWGLLSPLFLPIFCLFSIQVQLEEAPMTRLDIHKTCVR